jgi:hypothetical protein
MLSKPLVSISWPARRGKQASDVADAPMDRVGELDEPPGGRAIKRRRQLRQQLTARPYWSC